MEQDIWTSGEEAIAPALFGPAFVALPEPFESLLNIRAF
jgi:hypothetical protein